MIEFIHYSKVPTATQTLLTHYIQEAFGHISFVTKTQWATPEWTVMLKEEDAILTFVNIVLRDVNFDDKTIKVAGINNLITPAQYRGNGYASTIMSEVKNFIFTKLSVEHALLLCADSVVPFYQQLGWYRVDSSVSYKQPSEIVQYDSNTMLLSDSVISPPTTITLNGLPW